MQKQRLMSLEGDLTAADLKFWRKDEMGWTQSQAAAWLKVSLKAYQKWEQGYRTAHNPGPIKMRMKQARPRRTA